MINITVTNCTDRVNHPTLRFIQPFVFVVPHPDVASTLVPTEQQPQQQQQQQEGQEQGANDSATTSSIPLIPIFSWDQKPNVGNAGGRHRPDPNGVLDVIMKAKETKNAELYKSVKVKKIANLTDLCVIA